MVNNRVSNQRNNHGNNPLHRRDNRVGDETKNNVDEEETLARSQF